MAEKARELLLAGLRDAHAMEHQAEELLKRQAQRTDEFPEVQQQLKSHLGETREQKKRLEQCLKELGDSPSTIKDTAMSAFGNLMALGHTVAEDELLKNTLANNGFEHYEVAAYKSLLALCEDANAPQAVSSALKQSLREEEQMAEWVDRNVGAMTHACVAHLERQAA